MKFLCRKPGSWRSERSKHTNQVQSKTIFYYKIYNVQLILGWSKFSSEFAGGDFYTSAVNFGP